MASVYIAGRYSRRNEFRIVATALRAAGYSVTSRWLYEDKPLTTVMGDDTPEFYKETAYVDLKDIREADIVLFFSEDPLVGIPRGGRHVEFGYALGLGREIHVVGPRENIFHYVYGVKNYATLEDFLGVKA